MRECAKDFTMDEPASGRGLHPERSIFRPADFVNWRWFWLPGICLAIAVIMV
jgi:hypothetical protein